MENFAPRPVPGFEPRTIDITGYLSPFFADNQPSFIQTPGTDDLFLATFSTKATFDTFIAKWPVPYDKLVQIQDGGEFLSSIPLEIRVMVDPRPHPDGSSKVRYTEIFR